MEGLRAANARGQWAVAGEMHLQQRVHAVVHRHVQPADFVHYSLGNDDVGEGAAAAGALEKIDLMEDAVGVEDWGRAVRGGVCVCARVCARVRVRM